MVDHFGEKTILVLINPLEGMMLLYTLYVMN